LEKEKKKPVMSRYKKVIKINIMKCRSINCSAFLELNGGREKFCVEEIDLYFKTLSVHLTKRAERESREPLLT